MRKRARKEDADFVQVENASSSEKSEHSDKDATISNDVPIKRRSDLGCPLCPCRVGNVEEHLTRVHSLDKSMYVPMNNCALCDDKSEITRSSTLLQFAQHLVNCHQVRLEHELSRKKQQRTIQICSALAYCPTCGVSFMSMLCMAQARPNSRTTPKVCQNDCKCMFDHLSAHKNGMLTAAVCCSRATFTDGRAVDDPMKSYSFPCGECDTFTVFTDFDEYMAHRREHELRFATTAKCVPLIGVDAKVLMREEEQRVTA